MIRYVLRLNKSEASVNVSSRLNLFWLVFREDFRVCLLLFYLVWFETIVHVKVLWKFHQDLICSGWFREDLVLVWFVLKQYPSMFLLLLLTTSSMGFLIFPIIPKSSRNIYLILFVSASDSWLCLLLNIFHLHNLFLLEKIVVASYCDR